MSRTIFYNFSQDPCRSFHRHGRARPAHPRLCVHTREETRHELDPTRAKSWMAGPSPGTTKGGPGRLKRAGEGCVLLPPAERGGGGGGADDGGGERQRREDQERRRKGHGAAER